MGHWNYRIIYDDLEKTPFYYVAEIYYDDKGKIKNWEPMPKTTDLVAENMVELNDIYKMIAEVFIHPTLVLSELKLATSEKCE